MTLDLALLDFLAANKKTTVNEFLNSIWKQGPSAVKLLSEIAVFTRHDLTCNADVEPLGNIYLPWFPPNEFGDSGWAQGRLNYTVAEYSTIEDAGINILQASLRNKGIIRDIWLIIVNDKTLGKALLVDGCKRSVALYRMLPDVDSLLKDKVVHVVTMDSLFSHLLFPCDFLQLAIQGYK